MATDDRIRSAAEVPTLPSKTAVVPSDLRARNHEAVPPATALAAPMALAVATPELLAAPNAVALKVSVTSRVPVAAALALAGWVPGLIWIVPPLHRAATASADALAAASDMNGFVAITGPLWWVSCHAGRFGPAQAAGDRRSYGGLVLAGLGVDVDHDGVAGAHLRVSPGQG